MSTHNHIFISVLKGSSNLPLALQFQARVVYCHITKSYMCLYNNSLKLQTSHGLYFLSPVLFKQSSSSLANLYIILETCLLVKHFFIVRIKTIRYKIKRVHTSIQETPYPKLAKYCLMFAVCMRLFLFFCSFK